MNKQSTYNFKSITAAKFAEVLADFDETSQAAIRETFETLADGKMKRKALTITATLPDFIAQAELPELAKSLIERAVLDFIKAEYVDNFLPVGDHSWAHIEARLAESGRGGSLTVAVTDEQWAIAAASVNAFLVAANADPRLVTALCAVVVGKLSSGAIRKTLGNDKPETLAKLETRFTDWAVWASENDAENADDIAAVYAAITNKLNKMLKREDNVEVLALL